MSSSRAGQRRPDTHATIARYHASTGATADRDRRPSLLDPFRRRLIVTDLAVVVLAILAGLLLSSRASEWQISPTLAVYGVPPVIALLWLALLGLRGSYDRRIIGVGTEETHRVVSATLATFAVVAGLGYLLRADISRAYAFVSLPLGLVLVIVGRLAWRSWLYRRRRGGELLQPTVIVGTQSAAGGLTARLHADSYAGYRVVGTIPPPAADLTAWLDQLDSTLEATGATAVAVAPSEAVTTQVVTELAWRIEGRDLDLLIAPAVLDVTGPRLTIRPAVGLPLLHFDEAALSRPQAFAKRALDLVGSLTLSLLLLPVFAVCALAVRLSSRGPVLFRQTRIGAGGAPFTMLKFRTMVDGADSLRGGLREQTGRHEPAFKLAADPRITGTGRFLRRWSLDELPQLWNVVGGSMSLVGPRPHPLDDVDRYEPKAFRRLALKPGMTGLWQVEGRSDLPWEEALQLDLYYVETWSLSGDFILLARTVRAVLAGRGAV